MKYILILSFFLSKTLNIYCQSNCSPTLISIKHVAGADHYIPRLYIMREVKDFKNSDDNSLRLLTDENSFDLLVKFIINNYSRKKYSKDSTYEYGSYDIVLKQESNISFRYIIDNNSVSRDFFNKMKEYVRVNNIDENISKYINRIMPNSKESGLR